MPTAIITIDWKDDDIKKFLNSKLFVSKFNMHMSRQLIGFIAFMKAQVQRQMRNGGYPGNNIQRYIKGSDRVLFDTERFVNAIKAQYLKGDEAVVGAEIGWLDGRTSRGLSYPRLASILQEGREWAPTPKERKAVAVKAKKGGAPDPEGDPMEKWRIPPRPFLADAFMRQEVYEKFTNSVVRAVQNTCADLAKKG